MHRSSFVNWVSYTIRIRMSARLMNDWASRPLPSRVALRWASSASLMRTSTSPFGTLAKGPYSTVSPSDSEAMEVEGVACPVSVAARASSCARSVA